MKLNRIDAEKILTSKFKIPKFYDTQWNVIERVLNNERILLIEKTGFGKSLCFQFPATILEGTTIIFSPLISLMRDQVKKMNSLGISAGCINSEQSLQENQDIINLAQSKQLKLLYIAPERQESNEWLDIIKDIKIAMLVVDEAHCISVWGHDFRPAFRRIVNLVNLMPDDFPILATTATATMRVQNDIVQQIGNLSVVRGNLMRPNFKLFVLKVNSEDEKLIWLGKNIIKAPGTGIIYTGTRVDTEIYSKWLEYLNIPSTSYNAGLDPESRKEIENGLMNNKWKCIVSTNALGMGIDKPDIRFIIHTQIPQSPIHYYQEIGRAGRDNEPAFIILFYNPEDRDLPEAFIESAKPPIRKYEQVISALKSDMLSIRDLMRITNLKRNQIRVITADLIEQKIVREVKIRSTKYYEFISGSKSLNPVVFEKLREAKLIDLDKMIEYVETSEPRMKFLCDYLGDELKFTPNNCDNTGEKKLKLHITSEWTEKLNSFRENYFPRINIKSKNTNLVDGVAASYYGTSNVGRALHRSKYENGGDFPNFLLKLTLKAFRKTFGNENFDYIVYVPPTVSGDLVKNFATKISQILKIPISHNLVKNRETKEQKVFENNILKNDNVDHAFKYISKTEIINKKIILFDDIYDSGATIKEIGRLLTKYGASKIVPLVIAKTVAGDIKIK